MCPSSEPICAPIAKDAGVGDASLGGGGGGGSSASNVGCTCPSSYTTCPSGDCVYLPTDSANCGTCGKSCASLCGDGGICYPFCESSACGAGYPTNASQSSLVGIAVGPDGNIWFTDEGANAVGRVSSSGALVEFPIPTASAAPATGIAAGPDGNVWVTENATSKLASVTPAGIVTEHTLSAAVCTGPGGKGGGVSHAVGGLAGIAVGSDNNLWVASSSTDLILSVTTSASCAEFLLATGSAPYSMTLGPDGNVWFTEIGTNKIAKITTSGAVTEFQGFSNNALTAFDWITSGPDGNVWFTEQSSSKIAKIVPGTGAFTEYSVIGPGNSSLSPSGITTGPDGNLWFTAGGYLGKSTPTGTVTLTSLPPVGSAALGIVTGPDSNLWFVYGAFVGESTPH